MKQNPTSRIQCKTTTPRFLIAIALAFGYFALLPAPNAFGVVPAPDGGYPGLNTAEGQNALLHLTTGTANTAVGWVSLENVTTGSFNTGVGAGTLVLNGGDQNTATGAAALLLNTTGANNTANGALALLNNTEGNNNTATGSGALYSNTTGSINTAYGHQALFSNTTAIDNVAIGYRALFSSNSEGNTAVGSLALRSNTEGAFNTATGDQALYSTTTGGGNTANGFDALRSNNTGASNTAVGSLALYRNTTGVSSTANGSDALSNNITGGFNTANGVSALLNSTGNHNTALGYAAGSGVSTADHVIAIGSQVVGENVSNTCYIGNIFGVTSAGATAVYVNSLGKLGTVVSSRRFKDEIKPMDKASELIFALKPVTFRYKHEIDPTRSPQFGLVAEEVEKVNPDLVVRDAERKVNTVRYEAVNAMLLNEFLKEHRKVEEQQATITQLKSTVAQQQKESQSIAAQQQKEIQALAATVKKQSSEIQKVSAQLAAASPSLGALELSKFAVGRIRRGGPAPQVVKNP